MPNSNEGYENQVFAIRETVKAMIKNAKFGSNEDLMKNLSKLDAVSSRMKLQTNGSLHVAQKYGKILVPYDGSSFSKNALGEALDVAKVLHSKVYVLSVIDVSSDVPPGVLSSVVNEKLDKLKREIKLPKKFTMPTKLQRQIDECAKHGVDMQVEILIGNVVDSILKFAHQNRIELIVMGSRGLRGMKKLTALGSVSRRISEEARCPVMLVR